MPDSEGCTEPSPGLGALAPPLLVVSPNSFHVFICARPRAGHSGHCHAPGLTWLCPCGAYGQPGEPGSESCDGDLRADTAPGWSQGHLPGRDEHLRPFLLASALLW